MTAEIAILNANGVALAADSAVTIGGATQTKVFPSANKLFTLTKYEPVGIMVYGNADFMGLPWETVIKTYRKQLGERTFPRLSGYADHFVSSLVSDRKIISRELQDAYVRRTADEFFLTLRSQILKSVKSKFGDKKRHDRAEIALIAEEIVDERLKDFRAADPLKTAPKDCQTTVQNKYRHTIDGALKKAFDKIPLRQRTIHRLRECVFLLLTRDLWPDQADSGVVIAGFGDDEVYPSIRVFGTVATICGFMKRSAYRDGSISPDNGAIVMPFAQHEMVKTFMEGIDPDYRKFVDGFVSTTLQKISLAFGEELQGQLPDRRLKSIQNRMKSAVDEILKDLSGELDRFSRHRHWGPIVQIVNTLPKDELASMAEALVNLTSFKRKISMSAETVGGPIDVAVISKGDGFVWIKRKHYFKPELNSHFFATYYRG